MIQFNLLPDVKLEYIKTRRTKHMVTLVAGAVTALAVFVFVLLFVAVNVIQKQHISNLDKDIQEDISYLQSVEDLDKVLTVQNQLGALSGLHEKKPETSRLYTYLIQLTPSKATIGDITVDFSLSTMSISGTADKLETVNKFVDTLKFTEYQTDQTLKPFTNVVLTDFAVSPASGATKREVTYQIDFTYDPVIFNATVDGSMQVPKIISTRSTTEKPSDLFEQLPKTKTEDN